jgi:hypothetical protein
MSILDALMTTALVQVMKKARGEGRRLSSGRRCSHSASSLIRDQREPSHKWPAGDDDVNVLMGGGSVQEGRLAAKVRFGFH